jgi:hypothetical protein
MTILGPLPCRRCRALIVWDGQAWRETKTLYRGRPHQCDR